MRQVVHLFSRLVSVGVQFYSLSCADHHRAFCVSMLHVRYCMWSPVRVLMEMDNSTAAEPTRTTTPLHQLNKLRTGGAE